MPGLKKQQSYTVIVVRRKFNKNTIYSVFGFSRNTRCSGFACIEQTKNGITVAKEILSVLNFILDTERSAECIDLRWFFFFL